MEKVGRPKKTETKTKQADIVVNQRGRYKAVIIDAKKLREITEEKGYSVTKVCDIIGVANSAYWNWEHNGGKANIETVKRICNLLNIDLKDILVPTEPAQIVDEPKVDEPKVEVAESEVISESEVGENPFKEMGDTQNVHTQFDTVNTNVMILADVLKAYIDEKFDILNAKMDILSTEMHKDINECYQRCVLSLEEDRLIAENKDENKKPQAYLINKVEVNKLVTGYNENDTYETYKGKINRMVGIIAKITKTPHKNVLHGFYIEMTNTYGVLYDTCKKEFYAKYQRRDNGSTELLYDNPIYKKYFYDMIADALKDATKDMK